MKIINNLKAFFWFKLYAKSVIRQYKRHNHRLFNRYLDKCNLKELNQVLKNIFKNG